MINISNNMHEKLDNHFLSIIELAKQIVSEEGIPLLLIGAFARDILFECVYKVSVPRRTEDVDIAINVTSWSEFEHLKERLIQTGAFTETEKIHRIMWGEIPLDIIPFGEITSIDKTITWPIRDKKVMSVIGFDEVFQGAVTVILKETPSLHVRIPSVAGLVVLKLISWDEKNPERKKDAKDISFILNNIQSTLDFDSFFEENEEVLEEQGFDIDRAGVFALGREISSLVEHDTMLRLVEILERETTLDVSDLVTQMCNVGTEYHNEHQLVSLMYEGIKKHIEM